MRKIIEYLKHIGFRFDGKEYCKRLSVDLVMVAEVQDSQVLFSIKGEHAEFSYTLHHDDIEYSLRTVDKVKWVFGRLIEKYAKSLYNGCIEP